ncbi:MAG: phosphoglycolate phosphatase [Pseudomonadota bacterium]
MPKDQTLEDARHLLAKIQDYWLQQGYSVEGVIEPAGYSPRLRSTVYEVKTDLVNGFPLRKAS